MECTITVEQTETLTASYDHGEDCCPVAWARQTMEAFRVILCGRSLFCREGIAQLHKLVEGVSEGKAKSEELVLMAELCEGIRQLADCETARALAGQIAQTLEKHGDVWEQHIRRKRCAALQCNGLLTYTVDAAKCTGCGRCAGVCPVDCIDGGEGLFHVIRQEDCMKCGQCAAACQSGAVVKYAAGAVLPRLPEKPGTIGSFKSGPGGLKRGLRKKS